MLRQSIHNPGITTINFCAFFMSFFFFFFAHIDMYFYKTKRSHWFVTCFLPFGVSATTFLFRKDVPIYSSNSRCESNPIPSIPLALTIILLFDLCQFKGNKLLFWFALLWLLVRLNIYFPVDHFPWILPCLYTRDYEKRLAQSYPLAFADWLTDSEWEGGVGTGKRIASNAAARRSSCFLVFFYETWQQEYTLVGRKKIRYFKRTYEYCESSPRTLFPFPTGPILRV